jgi:hypothetical protein
MNGYIPETITTTGTVTAKAKLGHRAGNPQRNDCHREDAADERHRVVKDAVQHVLVVAGVPVVIPKREAMPGEGERLKRVRRSINRRRPNHMRRGGSASRQQAAKYRRPRRVAGVHRARSGEPWRGQLHHRSDTAITSTGRPELGRGCLHPPASSTQGDHSGSFARP